MSRFLVIDDDPIILQICKAYFSAKGNYVDTAPNGNLGIKKFKQEKFDLVITDLMMSNGHGYQVIDEIKSTPRGRETPVLLLTADQNEPELDLYERRKFQDDTLTKPFDMPLLEKKIKDLIAEFASRHEF